MWIYLAIISAVFLGVYDVCKKSALKDNSVLLVLFFATLFGALIMTPFIILSACAKETMTSLNFYVTPLNFNDHLLLAIKSLIVSLAWIFAYFAMKHLPISIATPIRSTGPMWSLIAAILIFKEDPTAPQWFGIIIILFSYYLFSVIGKAEGINFHKDKWVACIIIATLLSTASGLYDKYLIQLKHYPPVTVQAWFSIYLALFISIVYFTFWFPNRRKHTPFKWKWSIPLIAVFLITADLFYFHALNDQKALLAVISSLRRTNVIISFLAGAFIFKELQITKKAFILAGVLIGVLLIILFK